MVRMLGGCASRLFALVLVVAVVAAAWVWRGEIQQLWARATGSAVEASPELAARADEKLASLGEPGGTDRIALDQAELQSLIQYRWSGFLPEDVVDPQIAVDGGRVTLEGGVATARFGRVGELREIVQFLPDTASLRAVASFIPLDSSRVALEVHELGAAGIPVPKRLIPSILGRFRGSPAPGVGPNTIVVPLPPGIRSVYVSGDSMVFLANRSEAG